MRDARKICLDYKKNYNSVQKQQSHFQWHLNRKLLSKCNLFINSVIELQFAVSKCPMKLKHCISDENCWLENNVSTFRIELFGVEVIISVDITVQPHY